MDRSVDARHVRRWWKALLVAGIVVCVLLGAAKIVALHVMRQVLTTGPNGAETPASVGVPFERLAIPSGDRRHLDSYVVTARADCRDAPVVLIYHGVQETISEWVKAQQFLYAHCVSSIAFDYTGSGDSSRPARFRFMGEDSVAAYEFARAHFAGRRVYVLGHSLGNGPMLEAVAKFSSPPEGVVVANGFASLRSLPQARNHIFYRILSYAIPDWWNNVRSAAQLRAPLLVIHSDFDSVNPVDGARAIFAAAREPKALVILHGYRHNALYQNPREEWWNPVLGFVAQKK